MLTWSPRTAYVNGARMGIGFWKREFGAWLEPFERTFHEGEIVVDLGCGTGADVEYLHSLGMRAIGMDLSLPRVMEAQTRVPDAHFVVADLAAGFPFVADSFDLATASLSLHYFDRETTSAILLEVARILKPDGILLCRVNVSGESVAGWGSGVEHQPEFFEVEPGRFKRFFSPESLTMALSEHFETESVKFERTTMNDGFGKQTLVAQARLVG